MEYSKEFEMMVRSIVKEEINSKVVTMQFCEERFGRAMEKMGELDQMKRKLDRMYGILITALIGVFSTFVAVLLKLLK